MKESVIEEYRFMRQGSRKPGLCRRQGLKKPGGKGKD